MSKHILYNTRGTHLQRLLPLSDVFVHEGASPLQGKVETHSATSFRISELAAPNSLSKRQFTKQNNTNMITDVIIHVGAVSGRVVVALLVSTLNPFYE
jgi:hypothetical protein